MKPPKCREIQPAAALTDIPCTFKGIFWFFVFKHKMYAYEEVDRTSACQYVSLASYRYALRVDKTPFFVVVVVVVAAILEYGYFEKKWVI